MTVGSSRRTAWRAPAFPDGQTPLARLAFPTRREPSLHRREPGGRRSSRSGEETPTAPPARLRVRAAICLTLCACPATAEPTRIAACLLEPSPSHLLSPYLD